MLVLPMSHEIIDEKALQWELQQTRGRVSLESRKNIVLRAWQDFKEAYKRRKTHLFL
jgi:hypothetical protein